MISVPLCLQLTEKYRDLMERLKSNAAGDDAVLLLPERLPNRQVFEAHPVLLPDDVQLRPIDAYGSELDFEEK